jgi:signal transduction histidine kinase
MRAEERGRAASAFLARMSHELKTPLNVILGNAQLLQRRESLEGAPKAQVEAILLSGQHLASLVEDLLEQGRISAGGSPAIRPQRVELDLLLTELEHMLRERADERGLALRIEREPSAPALLHVDPRRLRQILLNLLVNALKFTEAGEVSLRARAASRPGDVVFEVRDSGYGIAAEALEQIFEPFSQLGPSEDGASGAGLGLSIARALARAMGGELAVESAPGEGSCFRLTLPVGEVRGPPAVELDAVHIPEAVRTRLRHWAERGNMSKLRQAAQEAEAEDPSLAPLCKALRACADAFDDARALELLEAAATTEPTG